MPVKPIVTAEEIQKIAGLAKLSLTPDQREEYTDQINTILDHMRTLETADTDGVEPLSHVLDLSNVTRPDAVVPSMPQDRALANAPKVDGAEGDDALTTDGDFFIVPSVIKHSL